MALPNDCIDPANRFRLIGQFDEFAYEEDLADFPECFDENGWPVFGEYDPYTLRHPITQETWHTNPRIPTKEENESDDTYVDWFHLADDFLNIQTNLLSRDQELFLTKPKRQTDVKFIYRSHVKQALDANRDYLQNDLIPPLAVLFSERSSSPSFIRLWGDFCRMAGEMDLVFDRKEKRHGQWQAQAKHEQLQWYAHYYLRERKNHKNAIETEKAICRLINAILDGKISEPIGFGVDWFETMLDLSGSVESNINYAKLTTAFTQKRLSTNQMKQLIRRPTKSLPPLSLKIPRP